MLITTSGKEQPCSISNGCSIERLYEVLPHPADKTNDTFEQMFERVS